MNIRKCANGHYYNGDRYKSCPYCAEAQELTDRKQSVSEERGSDNRMPESDTYVAETSVGKKKKTAASVKKKKYSEKEIRKEYEKLTKQLIERNISITTMESATSGQIASLITDTEGASAIFKGANVTYCNEAKVMMGVPAEIIERYTVYSKETAEAMASACAYTYQADIGIGVTGTMGNVDPENPKTSVPGEVYFAISMDGKMHSYHVELPMQPSRLMYKLAVAEEVYHALMHLLE